MTPPPLEINQIWKTIGATRKITGIDANGDVHVSIYSGQDKLHPTKAVFSRDNFMKWAVRYSAVCTGVEGDGALDFLEGVNTALRTLGMDPFNVIMVPEDRETRAKQIIKHIKLCRIARRRNHYDQFAREVFESFMKGMTNALGDKEARKAKPTLDLILRTLIERSAARARTDAAAIEEFDPKAPLV